MSESQQNNMKLTSPTQILGIGNIREYKIYVQFIMMERQTVGSHHMQEMRFLHRKYNIIYISNRIKIFKVKLMLIMSIFLKCISEYQQQIIRACN